MKGDTSTGTHPLMTTRNITEMIVLTVELTGLWSIASSNYQLLARKEKGERRKEKGERRKEKGEGRREKRRKEKGERRKFVSNRFCELVMQKLIANNPDRRVGRSMGETGKWRNGEGEKGRDSTLL